MTIAIINNANTACSVDKTNDASAIDSHRRQIIKRKVLAIGKMSRNYTVLKENHQLVQQLKSLSTNGKLPMGVLSSGEQGIKDAIMQSSFGLDSSKLKEQKDYNIYQQHPAPNYKVVSREGHV